MDLPESVLVSWLIYWKVEPWADQRADLRTALQSASFHQTMTGERASIDKFLPDFETDAATRERREFEQTVKAMEAISEGE